MIRLRFDTRQIATLCISIQKFVDKDIIPIAAHVLVNQIHTFTSEGLDFRGESFKPYTLAYAKFKLAKIGSNLPVNLSFTNDLLNSVGLYEIGSEHFVTMSDEQLPKAEGLDKKRKIWGVNDNTPDLVTQALLDGWNLKVNAT